MSPIRDRLLAALPAYLDRDPSPEPALRLSYAGSVAIVTVVHHRLRTRVIGGPGGAVDVELTPHTLDSLAAFLVEEGYTAEVLAEDGDVSALGLMEVDALDIVAAPARLDRATSFLWRALLMPMAWALEEARENILAGIRQTSLATAEGAWVDLWGEEFYGRIRRLAGEGDRVYADRIVREAIRERLNAVALEKIVEEDLGLEADVTNLHDLAWVVAETPFGILAGRKHSRTTFEVLVDAVSEALALVIERNRAAGTLPYFRFRETVGLPAPVGGPAVGAPTAVGSTAPLGLDRVWTIGVDPLGERRLSLPGDARAKMHLTARLIEPVLGQPLAEGFTLGEGTLGVDQLGDPGAGMLTLSEAVAVWLLTKVIEAAIPRPTESYLMQFCDLGPQTLDVLGLPTEASVATRLTAMIEETLSQAAEAVAVWLVTQVTEAPVPQPVESYTTRFFGAMPLEGLGLPADWYAVATAVQADESYAVGARVTESIGLPIFLLGQARLGQNMLGE